MELKDFIKETLSQIIDAVSETQEKYKDKHVLICPDDIQSEKGEYYIDNKFNSSKILHVIVWKSNYWKFYDFNWGTNKKQNC